MDRNDLFKKLYLRCSGNIELRALPSTERTFISLGTDWQTIREQVDKFCQDNEGQNLYFGVATRDGKGGTKGNVVSIPCVWADIDFKNTPEEEFKKKLKTFPFKPTITIMSGNGFHLYFLLEKPLEQKNGLVIENVNKWISTELGGDNVGNIDRILRLPNTINHKYNHRPLCEVVEINSYTYNIDDFLGKIPEPVTKPTKNENFHEKTGMLDSKTNTELMARVDCVIKQIEEKKIIFRNDRYQCWRDIAFSLADGLGEDGRKFFHRISAVSKEKYNKNDCDKQYDVCLNGNKPDDKITIATFFHYAKEAGLKINKTEIFESVSVSSLMKMDFTAPKWMVPSIIPEGLSILSGRPKIGKSIISLNLAVAVAMGGKALGKLQVEKSGVLYLALEDSLRRLQKRFRTILQNSEPPENLFLKTTFKSVKEGGLQQLDTWLEQHDDVGFVIIDTLARIRGTNEKNGDSYLEDYAVLTKIKEVADSHNIGIVLVHHTRKAESEDVFDMILGSRGITGAADTTIVLRKEQGMADVTMYVRGRDVEDAELALKFDNVTMGWVLIGDAKEYHVSGERRQILDVLKEAKGPIRLKEIATTLGKKSDNIGHLLDKLARDGFVTQPKYGAYAINDNNIQ